MGKQTFLAVWWLRLHLSMHEVLIKIRLWFPEGLGLSLLPLICQEYNFAKTTSFIRESSTVCVSLYP